MTRQTKETMMKFINSNKDLVDEYDVKDLYRKILQKKVNEALGGYFEIAKYSDSADYLIREGETFAENKKRIYRFFKKHLKNDQDMKVYFNCKIVYNWYYTRVTKETANILHLSNNPSGLSSVLHFLYYILTGEIRENLAEVNQWASDKGVRYDEGFMDKEFHGIIITRRGGTYALKGLTDEQRSEIKRYLNIFEDMHNKRI